MDISGLLGDLYESAQRDPVTDLPVAHADIAPGQGLAATLGSPAPAPDAFALPADREAEQRAAQIRAREAAELTSDEGPGGATPLPPAELHHELHHDDLLPRRGGKRLRIKLR